MFAQNVRKSEVRPSEQQLEHLKVAVVLREGAMPQALMTKALRFLTAKSPQMLFC